ncbi:unnamed protein product [Calypogeia fissa]
MRSVLMLRTFPRQIGEQSVAVEVSLQQGSKHVKLKILVTVVNSTDMSLAVCICPFSRLNTPDGRKSATDEQDVVVEELFENQRFQPLGGWGSKWPGHLMPTDPGHWSSRDLSSSSQELNKDLVRKMKKQGTVLLDYAHQSFIATGRRPLPMTPEPVLEQHKWEGLPAAFCANQEARTRRRVKIDLAKQRIAEARNGLKNGVGEASVDSSVSGQSVQEQSKANPEQSSKPNTSLDAEDLLIEHLVLRGASEADLENGYYRSLLALYPEQKDSEHNDDDPCSYIRS